MQAQFLSFVAGVEAGYYAEECLSVSVLAGGPGLDSIEWIQKNVTQFGTSFVDAVLGAAEAGLDHVIIAQQFQNSGTLLVTLKKSNITTLQQLASKRVATWKYLDAEVTSALLKSGVVYNHLDQTFGPNGLTAGLADAVMAMTYNEYAQLLQTTNNETGQLYRPDDFVTFDFNALGFGVLQDSIIVSRAYLLHNEDIVRRFLRGTMKGFAYCRAFPGSCVNLLYTSGANDHQTWQMNEINKLGWFEGVKWGSLNLTKWNITLDISRTAGTIHQPDQFYNQTWNGTMLEIARAELIAEGWTVPREGIRVFNGEVGSNYMNLTWCALGEDSACGNTATSYLCTGRERSREPSYNGYETPTGIAFLVVTSVGILFTIITFILVIVYWNNPIIRTASPEFLLIMLVAISLGFVSVYFWLGKPTTALCILRFTFPSMVFVVMFSPLLAKTWRIWYIFHHAKKLKATRVMITDLVPYIVAAIIIQMIITICWMTLATPHPAAEYPQGDLYTYYLTCDHPNVNGTDITVVFYGLTIGYNGLLLVVGAILAYKIRKLPSHFNESKAIALAIYNLFLISLIILILALTLTSPTTVGLFLMLGFFLGSFLSLVILFGPKFYTIFFRPNKVDTGMQTKRTNSKMPTSTVQVGLATKSRPPGVSGDTSPSSAIS